MGLKRAELVVSPDVQVPMVAGLFKARIYMPELTLTDEEARLVILHEYQHFRSNDTLVKAFYLALEALFWRNPAVHKFKDRLDQLLELRCDARITKKLNVEGKTAYLTSILSVIKQINGYCPKEQALALPLVDTTVDSRVVQRFKLVLSDEKQSRKSQVVAIAALILVFLLSYMVIVQPASFPNENDPDTGVFISPENSYILVSDDGSMKLYVDGEYFWAVDDVMIKDELHSDLPTYERIIP